MNDRPAVPDHQMSGPPAALTLFSCRPEVAPLPFLSAGDVFDVTRLSHWLQNQAKEYQLRYLLAHCEDGIIWGRFDEAGLACSGGVNLNPARLQQARMFSGKAELLLWRVQSPAGPGWNVRLVRDPVLGGPPAELDAGPPADAIHLAFDELQILWGTGGYSVEPGFTWLDEGRNGLRHCAPVPVASRAFGHAGNDRARRPVRLRVRHYLKPDAEGMYQVTLSRLAGLQIRTPSTHMRCHSGAGSSSIPEREVSHGQA